jgi:trehalose 6-phosphate phosphatase
MQDSERTLKARPSVAAADALFQGLPGRIDGFALFLDVDGTLLDIAATPEGVIVPPDLGETLARLSGEIDGALALVTGRSLAYLRTIVAIDGLHVAGLHGAERHIPGVRIPGVPVPEDLEAAGLSMTAPEAGRLAVVKARARAFAKQHPGALFEDKGAAFALHYRHAMPSEAEIRGFMAALVQEAGPDFALQHGKCVAEIRPSRGDKGDALRDFMRMPPFFGRRPLAIGDDLTDEAMFQAANAAGGVSVRVGEAGSATKAQARAESPEQVRNWLRGLVR